jgi:hypothetical protein
MPFGPYEDFEDCVSQNSNKENPEAYCASIEQEVKGASTTPRITLQIVPVIEDSPKTEYEVTDMDDTYQANADEFHTMMVLEGVWTGDGRYIEEGALTWRDLPLPLMATNRTTEGHMDAVLIGNITRVERIGREVHGYGVFVGTEDSGIIELQNLVRNGELRGVSVDLDAMEYEVIVPNGDTEAQIDIDGNTVVQIEDMKMRVLTARIMGATVVPFPAFQEAYIESIAALTASYMKNELVTGYINQMQSFEGIDFQPPQGARDEAERGLAWRAEYGRGGTEVGVARARDISNGKNLSPDTIKRMVSYFARHEVDKQGQGWSPDQDGYPSAGRIAWALWGGDAGRTWANKVNDQMANREERGSIVASGHPIEPPICPPTDWFDDPALQSPTPLTIGDDGRIFGHLAVWGQCHIGFTDRCIEPPASATNYAHFLTGEILCEGGERRPVGQITLNGNHAAHHANARQAAAHYDNTATAAADVTAGEDEFGIWVAGALRPDLNPSVVRALMCSDVSGDWRRIGGNLELVAVLAVNVPGFPKVRVAEAEGLVASISIPAFTSEMTYNARMTKAVERIASSIGRSRSDRIAQIAKRVNAPRIDRIARKIKEQ